jgi:hypothetical protein
MFLTPSISEALRSIIVLKAMSLELSTRSMESVLFEISRLLFSKGFKVEQREDLRVELKRILYLALKTFNENVSDGLKCCLDKSTVECSSKNNLDFNNLIRFSFQIIPVKHTLIQGRYMTLEFKVMHGAVVHTFPFGEA